MGLDDQFPTAFINNDHPGTKCFHCREGDFSDDFTGHDFGVVMDVPCEAESGLPDHTHERLYHERCLPPEVREALDKKIEQANKEANARWN